MNKDALFVDTAYVYALFSTRDQWHEKAVEWQKKLDIEQQPLLTTEFILTEIGDGLSALRFRQSAGEIIRILQENPLVEIVPASSDLFLQALELYEQRQDKNWGLTDCTSFVVMQKHNINEALTADEHFRQAGFTALLLD